MEKLKQVYQQLSPGYTLPTHQPILYSLVKLSRTEFAEYRLVETYEKFIIGYQNSKRDKPLYKIHFDWSVLFELIRDKNHQNPQIINEPYGVRIICPEKILEFFWLDQSTKKQQKDSSVKCAANEQDRGASVKEWRSFLTAKLNQRGFHELFRPQRKIGKGNFASVYLAIRLQDHKKIAVKAFSKQSTYGEEHGKESLVNEVQLMRRLNHKNLMKLYEVFESENSVYMCVELLEGGQLYDKVRNRHKFNYLEVSQIMRGILQGLQHMHAKRIMHRDLKPENIILRKQKDYDCVVADFGLSTWADQKKYLFARCGTPGYVAPEIVNLKDLHGKCEPVCDMFSLGVIFHILLLGKSPFVGKTYNQVLAQNRLSKFNFEADQYKVIPKQGMDLLKRMLEKNPEQRITAEQALKHAFFLAAEDMSNTVKSFQIPEQLLRIPNHKSGGGRTSIMASRKQRASLVCNSPLMTTANPLRKLHPLLNEDSCLKFKMRNISYDGSMASCDSSLDSSLDSSVLKQSIITQNGANSHYPTKQSRFASKPKQKPTQEEGGRGSSR